MTKRRQTSAAAGRSPFSQVVFRPREDLVAYGGSLDPAFVLDAYRHGLFPMGEPGGALLWWSPDPRGILPLDGFHLSRRLARAIAGGGFGIRYDTAFEAVMRACGEQRADGTWVSEPMLACYVELHRRGHAHSVEVWRGDELVGGTYGVAFGGVFAAESKFHRVRDASKVALAALVERLRDRGYAVLDVQWRTEHLAQFGVVEVPRSEYLARIRKQARRRVTFA